MSWQTANRNTLWAGLLVQAWEAAGLRAAVLAPGSRSTPLTVAFMHSRIATYIVPDERAAGFFALGLARATGRAVAVVTTSGTAAANLHPAVLEAHHSRVPLLALTADRPAELYDSGANQTTDQQRLFGPAVRWFHQVALPEAAPGPRLLRYLQALAHRSLARAQGLTGPPGPVHLNLPFRKPLEPTPVPEDRAADAWQTAQAWARPGPYVQTLAPPPAGLAPEAATELARVLHPARRGVVVAGPAAAGEPAEAEAIAQWARAQGWPLLADPLSGLRFGPWVRDTPLVAGGVSRALAQGWRPPQPPQVVVLAGNPPVGFGPLRFLAALPPGVEVVAFAADGEWNDPEFYPGWRVPVAAAAALAALPTGPVHAEPFPQSPWLQAWLQAEAQNWPPAPPRPLDEEGQVAWHLTAAAPEDALLFASNSLPIRHLDEWGRTRARPLRVAANRGLSGIDGVLATATGMALAHPGPTVLLIGDLALYHDLNSLLLAPRFGVPLAVVVLNNNGGRIFERLPIARFDPPFTEAFRVPLNLDFAAPARGFGWRYAAYALRDPGLPAALAALWRVREPTLLEVRVCGPAR